MNDEDVRVWRALLVDSEAYGGDPVATDAFVFIPGFFPAIPAEVDPGGFAGTDMRSDPLEPGLPNAVEVFSRCLAPPLIEKREIVVADILADKAVNA